jgi:hypothetical protein
VCAFARISSRSRISRRGICSSVCLITAGAPKNPRKKCYPGYSCPKEIRVSEVRLLYRGSNFRWSFWKFAKNMLPRVILLREEILGKSTKTIFKSNINLIRKVLNFVTIQWNNLQASPISWDYPFNVFGTKGYRCSLDCWRDLTYNFLLLVEEESKKRRIFIQQFF